MPLYFKDRITDSLHGQNEIFFDALDSAGSNKLADFKLAMKNNIQAGNEGTPLNAANMNYAAGIVDMPVAPGQNITKGALATLTGGKAALPFTPPNAVETTNANIAVISCFHLSDSGALSYYLMGGQGAGSNNYIWIMSVNWQTGAVNFGAAYPISVLSQKFELISPTLACMTSWYNMPIGGGNTQSYETMVFYNISGTSITGASLAANGVYGYSGNVRPVKCGNNGCLIAASDALPGTAGSVTFKLFRYTAGTSSPTIYTSAPIPSMSDANNLLNLVSIDGGGSKFVVFVSVVSDIYSSLVTVNPDNTISWAGWQDLGGNYNELGSGNIVTFCHQSVGQSMSHNALNKFIFSAPYDASNAGKPAVLQSASIDAANGFVNMGAKLALPVVPGNADLTLSSGMPVYHDPSMFVAQRPDGSAYVMGVSNTSPYRHRFYEIASDFSGADGALPFNSVGAGGTTFTRCMAVQNPNDADSYLFIDNSTIGVAQSYYLGSKYNAVNPENIFGVALDIPVSGFVKIQTSPKILPGIKSGLVGGMQYRAGSNGMLAQYSGSGTPIGRAVSPTDFSFYGDTQID